MTAFLSTSVFAQESKPLCPSVESLAVQWAEAIAAGALVSPRLVEKCLQSPRNADIRLPRTSASEPDPSELQPDSRVSLEDGFRVESVRNGEMGTRVVRLSWMNQASKRRESDELTLLLHSGAAARELGCAGLYEGFKKHRVRLTGCR